MIIRHKRIRYDLNVMRQSACLLIYPITVDNFAALFNCTAVDQASDSMTAPTSQWGSGNDRTIAFVRKVWAIAILYIGRSVNCGIDYVFTPEEHFSNTHTHRELQAHFICLVGKLYLFSTF